MTSRKWQSITMLTWPTFSSRLRPSGRLVPGRLQILIFVDYKAPTEVTTENLPWHIIFGFQQSMVTTTIVAGKVLMKDRELLTLDEEKIAARARELSAKVWKRYQAKFAT